MVDHFLSLSHKHGWVRLAFMVWTATGKKNILRVVKQIQLDNIQNKSHGYFGLMGIGNHVAPLPNPLTVSANTQLFDGTKAKVVEIQNFFESLH